jgi:hypothetical protein
VNCLGARRGLGTDPGHGNVAFPFHFVSFRFIRFISFYFVSFVSFRFILGAQKALQELERLKESDGS